DVGPKRPPSPSQSSRRRTGRAWGRPPRLRAGEPSIAEANGTEAPSIAGTLPSVTAPAVTESPRPARPGVGALRVRRLALLAASAGIAAGAVGYLTAPATVGSSSSPALLSG